MGLTMMDTCLISAVIEMHRAALVVLAANMQPDPKKQGKEKKPGTTRVSLVFLNV